jgi:hypothetical protein
LVAALMRGIARLKAGRHRRRCNDSELVLWVRVLLVRVLVLVMSLRWMQRG